MQLNFDKVQFIVGDAGIAAEMPQQKPMHPFSDDAMDFLDALSKKVMRSGHTYSDVVTFGFWCRRAALLMEKNRYQDIHQRFGRGIVFHIAPSNVPVNFAFSFAAGLLAGNANIVRIPSKDFPQVQIICDAINELLKDRFKQMADYICMVRYPASQEINDLFSFICDTRVIWGGNQTVAAVRKSPLKPRANEITFADRYSVAVIDADSYLHAEDKERIAQDFYNDTYFSDQNACTSPRLIVWVGKEREAAKKAFWEMEHKLVKEKYELAAVQAVGKLTALDKVAAEKNVKLIDSEDNLIYRVCIDSIDQDLMDYKYNSGFFFEYDAEDIWDITTAVDEQCQTLIYYGLPASSILENLTFSRPHGIDRIVPLGKSMDFSLMWDGHDLIREMSRFVDIR